MPLPPGLTHDEVAAAVAASTSWRGVLRLFGLSSAHRGRQLRAYCEWNGIDASHFRRRSFDDATLRAAVATARSWDDLLTRLGLATTSGSARDSVRKHGARLGLDLSAVERRQGPSDRVWVPSLDRLRDAGSLLVAAAYVMSGHQVSWPLEPAAFDLIVSKHARPAQRVQVKTTTCWAGDTWVCSISRSRYTSGGGKEQVAYEPDDIDVFAVLDGHLQLHLIPAELLAGARTVSLRRWAAFRVAAPWGLGSRAAGDAVVGVTVSG